MDRSPFREGTDVEHFPQTLRGKRVLRGRQIWQEADQVPLVLARKAAEMAARVPTMTVPCPRVSGRKGERR